MGCVGGLTNVGLSSCCRAGLFLDRRLLLPHFLTDLYIGHGTISDCDVGNLRQDSFKNNVLTHLKVQLD